jgi:hypothetical protein
LQYKLDPRGEGTNETSPLKRGTPAEISIVIKGGYIYSNILKLSILKLTSFVKNAYIMQSNIKKV